MNKLILIFIPLMIICNFALAGKLEEIKQDKFTFILSNFQVLQEMQQQNVSMWVRILKVQEFGECDGSPQSCPKAELFISVSEYGEYPIQKIFHLPMKHEWKFIEPSDQPSMFLFPKG